MNVTRSNFRASLDIVLESISSADVVSFDTELTGLLTANVRENILDSVPQRYAKLLKGSEKFIITQFGICTFQWLSDEKRYEAKPFNFYVFPRQFRGVHRESFFLCQSSSLEFLVQNNFDFNKVFYQGISYLTKSDEEDLRKKMEPKDAQPASKSAEPKPQMDVPEANKPFVEERVKTITDFLESDKLFLDLPPCNSFLRRLTYQIGGQFPSIHLQHQDGGIRIIRVVGNLEESMSKAKAVADEEYLKDAAGVSLVFRALLESNKLLVGHNMALDILHCLRQFQCPLPEDFAEFQKVLCQEIPRVADNKVLAQHKIFQGVIDRTHLASVFAKTSRDDFSVPTVALSSDMPCVSQAHDAAYDAYMTGYSFIKMAHRLCGNEDGTPVDFSSSQITDLHHKVHMMKSLDMSQMDFSGENPVPSRDNVMRMTFPQTWRYDNIVEFMGDAVSGPIQVHWIDSTSAYVVLADQQNAEPAIEKMQSKAEEEGVSLSLLESCSDPCTGPDEAVKGMPPTPLKRKSASTDPAESDEKRSFDRRHEATGQ